MKSLLSAALTGLALFSVGELNAATVLMDFGSTTVTNTDGLGRAWNTISETSAESAPLALISTDGAASGVSLQVSNITPRTSVGWNGTNTNGTQAPTGDAAARGYPASATRDSLYGNVGLFNSTTAPDLRMTFTGLNAATTYDLYFYASRTSVTDVRTTDYAVTGLTGPTVATLDASNNIGTVVSLMGIAPDSSGRILIDVDPGATNNNSSGFYYLGVMEIVAVPEPSGVIGLLALGGLLGGRRFRKL